MGFLGFLEEISPTVLGIVSRMAGSFFTVIGVILTNASNTKRLRLQNTSTNSAWRARSAIIFCYRSR
jgi:hypothetical protein